VNGLIYWLMGERAVRVVVGGWGWGLPVEAAGKAEIEAGLKGPPAGV
jgi:hypothetical protein